MALKGQTRGRMGSHGPPKLLAVVVCVLCAFAWFSRGKTPRQTGSAGLHRPSSDHRHFHKNPVERKIVPDLTEDLLLRLQSFGIRQLLLFPGQQQNATLDIEKLSRRLRRVSIVQAAHDMLAHDYSSPCAALVYTNGGTGSQLGIIASVASKLGPSLQLILAFKDQKDRPAAIVSFDPDGRPFTASLQETVMFRDAFTNTYKNQQWGAEGGGSGGGSTLQYTRNIRQLLGNLLAKYKITSMLDSSCGSMHWMPLVLEQYERVQKGFKFMGTDVVCMLIDQHKLRFANHTNWSFQCIDYSAQRLPTGYELVWSRDSLQHVTWHAVWQFLNNVRASGARYLLVGSYIKEMGENEVVLGGDQPQVASWRINLLKPPFNLSEPLEVIDEGDQDGKHMLLFDVSKMLWHDDLLSLV